MKTSLRFAVIAAALALSACASDTTARDGMSATAPVSELGYAPAGLERLVDGSRNGATLAAFAPQRASVTTNCFPAALKSILGSIRTKFGVTPIVTSGHRPRAGRSQHTSCRAADIRVPGVQPSAVAAYARSIKGIGGVGTYCNGLIHVDVGPRRDWHHCNRRRR